MKINRNYYFSLQLVNLLYKLGVRNAIISPGSRSAPLVYALSKFKKIRMHNILDERSAAFFASGVSRKTGRPVMLVCTSGTATAEYYPAVIESAKQYIPLIICTADRPEKLRFSGANQTINQYNLYSNHISEYFDIQVAKPTAEFYSSNLNRIYDTVVQHAPGPIHINIAFEKPFEPDVITDEISSELISEIKTVIKFSNRPAKADEMLQLTAKMRKKISSSKMPCIVLGPGKFSDDFAKMLTAVSGLKSIPVIADFSSGLRLNKYFSSNQILFSDMLLNNEKFLNLLQCDLLIHFGMYPVSKAVDKLLSIINAQRIIVNKFGENYGGGVGDTVICKSDETQFLSAFNSLLAHSSAHSGNMIDIQFYQQKAEMLKYETLSRTVATELSVINSLCSRLSDNCNLFLSNSLIVRDFDRIVESHSVAVNVFHNRGASGIDGLLSSASGISLVSKDKTVLVIGDLSFLYDISALGTAVQKSLNLLIVLLDNDGGRIFEYLPSSKYSSLNQQYFIAPQGLNIKSLVKAYGINYYEATSIPKFEKLFTSQMEYKGISVLRVVIDNNASKEERKNLNESIKQINLVNKP